MHKYQRAPQQLQGIAGLVQLVFRSSSTGVIHESLLPAIKAARIARKLQKAGTVDYAQLTGLYATCSLWERPKLKEQRRVYFTREQLIRRNMEAAIVNTSLKRRSWKLSNEVSFQGGKLEQDCVIFCNVTGIFGKLEMPALPVAFSYQHPLATPGNVLSLVAACRKERERPDLDRQILAGCVISLLREKSLLRIEEESTSVEQNTTLQGAGKERLWNLLFLIEHHWRNAQVWKRMPSLTLSWKTHKSFPGTIGEAVDNFSKILREILDPSVLTSDEQAAIFAAQRKRNQTQSVGRFKIKVYSAAAVQERNIKDSKTEIRELFEILRPHLSIVHRAQVGAVIRDLLILPEQKKAETATLLRVAFIGKPQANPAKELANLLEKSKNDALLSDIGSFTQEVSPIKSKSIAEILAAKKEKAKDGE